jgi:hypothetical protein
MEVKESHNDAKRRSVQGGCMFHTLHNLSRDLRGKPTEEKPPKERLVDLFADPGGDWSANQELNRKAAEEESSAS